MNPDFIKQIFSVSTVEQFNTLALEAFNYQSKNNPVYQQYNYQLGIDSEKIKSISQIPFLPISFFKTHQILSINYVPEVFFTSSGTTGTLTSRHYIGDVHLYEQSFLKGFNLFYGNPKDIVFLCLLPSYLEQGNSSLIYMAKHLIKESKYPESDFFLSADDKLITTIQKCKKKNLKTILLGVSYALVDFAEKNAIDLKNIIVMETGGMKGRKKEITREELHLFLKKQFGVNQIHSEYGMTELLSQAYSKADGKYFCPPWMKILIRDINDPFTLLEKGKTGGVNIIDLANINSCCFIETQDLGRQNEDGSFEILGRFDNSDIRGCSLLTA